MEPLIMFIFKSLVVSGIFAAWYILGLRGFRLHQYNRFFLLSSLVLSILIPFLHFNIIDIAPVVSQKLAPVSLFIQPDKASSLNLPVVSLEQVTHFQWLNIVGLGVITISIFLLVLLITRILVIKRLSKQFPVSQIGDINIIQTNLPNAPFAFFSYLFWNQSIPLDDEIGQLIFRHEAAHIKQRHTYDKLFCQLLTCFFWFNPFFWIIQKELNLVHEFIADEQAVKDRDTQVFAMMVLKTYNNGSHFVPQHHFFSSTIKRRLQMLQNLAEPSFGHFRRFMVLPLITLIVLAFSCNIKNDAGVVTVPAKKKMVVLIDPAHGGMDAGATAGELTEKEISLKLANRLKEVSPRWNIDVQLTRSDDSYITPAQRLALADNVKPDLFLSLHLNNEPGTEKAKGDFDIYLSAQSSYAEQSSNYSTAIFTALQRWNILPNEKTTCNHGPNEKCENCLKNVKDQSGQVVVFTKKDDLYLLKNSNAPCLIMILGNINNRERMKQYTDADRLDRMCNTILNGIVNVANTQTSADKNNVLFAKSGSNLNFPTPSDNAATSSCGTAKVSGVQLSFNRSQ